jgi:hypothetical protein
VGVRLYTLSAFSPQGSWSLDGFKGRIKYIHKWDTNSDSADPDGPYVGANLEVGRSASYVEAVPWNVEFKGIMGSHFAPWHVAVNINLDGSIGGVSRTPTVEVDSRLARDIGHEQQVAIELYNGLGPMNHFQPLNTQGQIIYMVYDRPLGKMDLELGVGHGVTNVSDPWVLKMIMGMHF